MVEIANNVHQQTTATGTGNLSLTTVTGRQTFNDAFGTGGTDVFYYFIRNRSANEWEVGTGHLSDASTLVRDTVLKSSNSDSAVSFGSGTKDITNDVPAAFLEFVATTPRVHVATTGNVDLSTDLADGQTVDGRTVSEGENVLVPHQTDASENGIYPVPASGAASRHPAFATFDAHAGIIVSVMEGDTYANAIFQCTANEGGTLGSSDIPFALKAPNVVAGDGIDVNAAGNDVTVSAITPDVRQTALHGPTDANGRADFVAAGTGLQAVTSGLPSDPLVVTAAQGFSAFGGVNIAREISSNLTWDSLPASSTVFLGVDVSDGSTVDTTSLDYGYTHPSSPSSGDYSFLIPDMQMYRFDGSSWVATDVVFVGAVDTDGASVTSATSYAYRGRYKSDRVQGVDSGAISFDHNIGVSSEHLEYNIKSFYRTATGGWSANEDLGFINESNGNSDRGGSFGTSSLTATISFVTSGWRRIMTKSGGNGNIGSPSDMDFVVLCKRAF